MPDPPAHNLNTSPSLLERLRQPSRDDISWQRFMELYRPWLGDWLRRRFPPDVAEDVVQDVLVVVCRRLPDFEHNQRTGAFRAWLKEILKNCLRDCQKKHRPADSLTLLLEALEDPRSDLQQQWDVEHDRHVLHHLLEQARRQFSDLDNEVFCRVKLRRESVLDVAAALGISSPANVYKKVSRVFDWLRDEARGLLDESAF